MDSSHSSSISIDDFDRLDIRVGVVREAIPFPEGRHSTHILAIDFGERLGVKKSLARLAPNYGFEDLIGQYVLGVTNLPARQIGSHRSEVLTLGVADSQGHVVLIQPQQAVPLGSRLH